MSRYRKGAGGKRDENEPEIIKVLRAHGCVVMQLSGKGIPDLLVLRAGKKWLADVKMPGKPTTEAQEELWEEAATKAGCAVFILRTPEDAQKMLNNALQPWEPTPRGGYGVKQSKAALSSRKGDVAKAPSKAERHAARLRVLGMRAEVVLDGGVPVGMLAEAGYTPPRSKPVDAAKEAEAFAPATPGGFVITSVARMCKATDPCGMCEECTGDPN